MKNNNNDAHTLEQQKTDSSTKKRKDMDSQISDISNEPMNKKSKSKATITENEVTRDSIIELFDTIKKDIKEKYNIIAKYPYSTIEISNEEIINIITQTKCSLKKVYNKLATIKNNYEFILNYLKDKNFDKNALEAAFSTIFMNSNSCKNIELFLTCTNNHKDYFKIENLIPQLTKNQLSLFIINWLNNNDVLKKIKNKKDYDFTKELANVINNYKSIHYFIKNTAPITTDKLVLEFMGKDLVSENKNTKHSNALTTNGKQTPTELLSRKTQTISPLTVSNNPQLPLNNTPLSRAFIQHNFVPPRLSTYAMPNIPYVHSVALPPPFPTSFDEWLKQNNRQHPTIPAINNSHSASFGNAGIHNDDAVIIRGLLNLGNNPQPQMIAPLLFRNQSTNHRQSNNNSVLNSSVAAPPPTSNTYGIKQNSYKKFR